MKAYIWPNGTVLDDDESPWFEPPNWMSDDYFILDLDLDELNFVQAFTETNLHFSRGTDAAWNVVWHVAQLYARWPDWLLKGVVNLTQPSEATVGYVKELPSNKAFEVLGEAFHYTDELPLKATWFGDGGIALHSGKVEVIIENSGALYMVHEGGVLEFNVDVLKKILDNQT